MSTAEERQKRAAYMRRWYAANKDKVFASVEKYRQTPKGKEVGKAARKKWGATPKAKAAAKQREKRYRRRWLVKLKTLYGLTEDAYFALLEKQKSKCAICRTSPSYTHRKRVLSVDHNHETGQVRGLLCSWCNSMLGIYNDSADTLQRAIRYLAGDPTLEFF